MAMMKVCSCSIWWSRHISNVDQPTHWCAHIVAVLMQCCNRAVRVWVDLTKLNDQVTKELLMTWPRNFSNKVIPISVAVVISGQLTCMFLKRPLIYLWKSDEMKNLWSLAEQPVKPAHEMVAMTSSGFLIICSLKNFMEIKPKLLPCLEDLLPTTGYNFFCPLQTHSMALQFPLMQGFPIRLQQCVINLDKPVHYSVYRKSSLSLISHFLCVKPKFGKEDNMM